MSELVPITPEKYGSRRWQRYTSYSFAATTSYAPLVGAELQRAMQNMPLAFIKQEQSFHIAAVLSLSPGGNLFVDPKGRWLGGVRALDFQRLSVQTGQSAGAGQAGALRGRGLRTDI